MTLIEIEIKDKNMALKVATTDTYISDKLPLLLSLID